MQVILRDKMKFTVFLCVLALVTSLAMAKPLEEFTTPKWDMETCEERAKEARRDSKKCRDYQCVQHSHGLVLDGVNCFSGHEHNTINHH